MWHVHASQAVAQLGEEECDKAGNPLKAEEDDRRQTNPRVQAVHVGNWLERLVVRVEDGLEADRGEYEHQYVNEAVQHFHVQLCCRPQQAIDKYSCAQKSK